MRTQVLAMPPPMTERPAEPVVVAAAVDPATMAPAPALIWVQLTVVHRVQRLTGVHRAQRTRPAARMAAGRVHPAPPMGPARTAAPVRSPVAGDLTDGLATDGLSGTVSDVVQTVSTVGSSGPLQDIVNTSGLLHGLDVNNLDNVLGGSLGGNALGGNGLDGVLGATNGITPVVSNLGDSAVQPVDPVVSAAGHAVDTVAGGGGIGDVLNGAGNDVGNLVDAVRGDIDSVTSNGVVGNVVDGLGDSVLNGAVGGGGLLADTPLDWTAGRWCAGEQQPAPGRQLLAVEPHSARCRHRSIAGPVERGRGQRCAVASGSNDLVDTNIGPSSSDNGVNANLLGASQDSGALIDADAGHTQQASPITVDAATNADQFQFPALAGTGADSLVGETGQLPGDLVTVDTRRWLAAAVGEAERTALADISGPDGVLDSPTGDGTHIAVNTRTPRSRAR